MIKLETKILPKRSLA